MKKILTKAAVLLILLIASTASAVVLDAPHNAAYRISCPDCHNNAAVPDYHTDDICLTCHMNATGGGYNKTAAPKVLTHSSANTNTKYGNWTIQCADCHIQHFPDLSQRAAYGTSAVTLVTGSIISVSDNGNQTTTFGYNNLQQNVPGWSDYTQWNKKSSGNSSGGNERGLIIYPNASSMNVSFEIQSATANSITVKGSINGSFNGSVSAGNTFVLAYGEVINSQVVDPAGNTHSDEFIQNKSVNSFAYNDSTVPSSVDPMPNGICQVCHTQTDHWRNDGTRADHNSGVNCTLCHRHEEGFMYNCTGCHASPPPTGKHAIHFGNGSVSYGTSDVQSTSSSYSFSCGICHNGTHMNTPSNPHTAEVIFQGIATTDGAGSAAYSASTPSLYDQGTGWTFNYSDGTCSSVYCHGNYPGSGNKATPSFNTGTAVCGSCHGASNTTPPASGSHSRHASNTAYNFSCTLCHNNVVSGAGPSSYTIADKSKHVNGAVDWKFDPAEPRTVNAQYTNASGSFQPSDGLSRPYGYCANTYCHSNGTTIATQQQPVNASNTWGGSVSCTSCHDWPPSYTSGAPKANSHKAHNDALYLCPSCHYNTTIDGFSITNYANHVNKTYDVYPNLAAGVTLTYTFSTTGGSCSNISCHGGNSAQWGTKLICQNCHLGVSDVDDFSGIFYNNGVTARIATGEWNTTGHGRPAASGNYASGNAPADFTVTHACLYCHDDTITHKTASNPFRLRSFADTTWGKNGVCQNCHSTASAGVSIDLTPKNALKKVGSFHYGTKHGSAANGGQFCWDCHDPHGDQNLYMIGKAVAAKSNSVTGAPTSTVSVAFTSNTTGTGYAQSSAPYNGVCQVCHSLGNTGASGMVSHYSSTSGDHHNENTRCTTCHKHTGKAQNDGFAPSCDGCHGYPPVSNTTLVGFVYPSSTGSTTAGAHQLHVNSIGISCTVCHLNSVGSGTLHNTGDYKVKIGFLPPNASYPGGVYNGQTTVNYIASEANTAVLNGGLKSCSNVYCHGSILNSGGTDTTPVWDNPSTATCGSCHGASVMNPPTAGSHLKHTGFVDGFANNRQLQCEVCHGDYTTNHVNGQTNWAIGTTPTYSWLYGGLYKGLSSGVNPTVANAAYYSSCSNVYCHSIVQTATGGPLTGQPGEYKTPHWGNSADGVCGSCHDAESSHTGGGATISTGSHAKHLSYTFNTTVQFNGIATRCAVCHKLNPAGSFNDCSACHSNEVNLHINHKIDIAFEPSFVGAGSYNGSQTPGTGFAGCSNTYCHSNGSSVRTGSIPANSTPNWGSGSVGCNTCHGNNTYPAPNNAMPNYPNKSPKENSHPAHVIGNNISCANCHAGTTTTGTSIANTSLHVNGQYNAQASGSFGGQAVSFTYSGATATVAGSCSTISCHGGNAATWGSSLACGDCHYGPVDMDNFSGTFWNNGTPGKINITEWTTTGHGRTTGTYASGNPPAMFSTITGTNTVDHGCYFCHDSTVSHHDGTNPFRLRNLSDATWGKNGACQTCHAAGSAGMLVDGVLRNGTKKIGSTHYGSKHNTTANGGQFCWDCHDPHGDNNVFMIHASVAKTSDPATGAPVISVPANFSAFATGTDYAKSVAPYDGVCNVCHTLGSGVGLNSHYSSTSGDHHNETIRCTNCHKHTDDAGTTTAGFKPFGDNCYDCHSSGGGATPGTTPDAYHAKHVKNPIVGKVSLGTYGSVTQGWYRYSNVGGSPDMGCGYCHPQSNATHMNGSINLNFDPNDGGAAGTLKAKNGTAQTYSQTTRVNVTCSSVYCHSNGYFDGTAYGYGTTPNWYGGAYAGDKCAGCHGNSPTGSPAHAKHVVGNHYNKIYSGGTGFATAGNTDTSSHGNPNTSTTLNCNLCHNNTVKLSNNDNNTLCVTCHTGSNLKGAMTIDPNSTTHVNGVVDVVFAPVQVKVKAQIRNNTVSELSNNWQRNVGYKVPGAYDSSLNTLSAVGSFNGTSKTCSSIACHNGFPIQWNSTVSCGSCHTSLP